LPTYSAFAAMNAVTEGTSGINAFTLGDAAPTNVTTAT